MSENRKKKFRKFCHKLLVCYSSALLGPTTRYGSSQLNRCYILLLSFCTYTCLSIILHALTLRQSIQPTQLQCAQLFFRFDKRTKRHYLPQTQCRWEYFCSYIYYSSMTYTILCTIPHIMSNSRIKTRYKSPQTRCIKQEFRDTQCEYQDLTIIQFRNLLTHLSCIVSPKRQERGSIIFT